MDEENIRLGFKDAILHSYTLVPSFLHALMAYFAWLFGILSPSNSNEGGISMATEAACELNPQQRQSASYLGTQSSEKADVPFIDCPWIVR